MSTCIFCQIVDGELASDVVYTDDTALAFNDIKPHAPVHLVLIPKQHVSSIDELTEDHAELMSQLFVTARKLGREYDKHDQGYRISVNSSKGAEVPHLHLHVLTGTDNLGPPAGGGDST